jgi:hypothetical protein
VAACGVFVPVRKWAAKNQLHGNEGYRAVPIPTLSVPKTALARSTKIANAAMNDSDSAAGVFWFVRYADPPALHLVGRSVR